MNMFRTLRANEIECRVQSVKKNGVVLLLYKDARCDQIMLDETVGPFGWMRTHSRDNANCTVSIWDEKKKVWVSKEDTGTESNTEAKKGLASDSFKRACFNWGIGRELYTAPFIWIPASQCAIKEYNGKHYCYDRFSVKEISYNDQREICWLVIVNAKTGAVVYSYGASQQKYMCDRCGKEIIGTTSKDGQPIPPAQLVQISRKRYNGGTYCAECQKALEKARAEREAALSGATA